MRRRLGSGLLQRTSPWAFDVALALVFVVIAQTDVWAPWDDGDGAPFADPRWLSSLLMFTATAPLVFRRRMPLLTAVALSGSMIVEVTLVSPTASFLGNFIPMLVAAYSVAAYQPLRRALLGFGILGLGVFTVTLSVAELRTFSEVPFELVVLLTAWFVGRFVHRLRTRAEALSEHADQLEQRREALARMAVDVERTRIARELHDVIAHSVSLMGVQAAAAEQVLALDPERAREPLRAIQDTARDAIDELRRLLGVLRERDDHTVLRPQPGLGALDALVEQMRGAGLPVELHVEGRTAQLSPGVELSAYRVIQEALTNALKHAHAAHTTVVVRHRPHVLELEIADDGAPEGDGRNGNGTNGTNGSSGGHGLIGMRERVALYGGTISSGRRSGGGYAVRATLPTRVGRP